MSERIRHVAGRRQPRRTWGNRRGQRSAAKGGQRTVPPARHHHGQVPGGRVADRRPLRPVPVGQGAQAARRRTSTRRSRSRSTSCPAPSPCTTRQLGRRHGRGLPLRPRGRHPRLRNADPATPASMLILFAPSAPRERTFDGLARSSPQAAGSAKRSGPSSTPRTTSTWSDRHGLPLPTHCRSGSSLQPPQRPRTHSP
jgi:hypothetical protein